MLFSVWFFSELLVVGKTSDQAAPPGTELSASCFFRHGSSLNCLVLNLSPGFMSMYRIIRGILFYLRWFFFEL
jgi:hypothetical protein